SRVADQFHAHTAAGAAALPTLLPDPQLGAGRFRQALADPVDQRRDLAGALLEVHLGTGAAPFGEPRVHLPDPELLAIGVEVVLDPQHFGGDLLQRVVAMPAVADHHLVGAAVAEHVELGPGHRDEADQQDHRDAGHAPAAVV